jgi:hypothetical protein
VDPKSAAECLLGLALRRGQVAEHPEVARMELEAGESLGEAPMGVSAQLREQKAGALA